MLRNDNTNSYDIEKRACIIRFREHQFVYNTSITYIARFEKNISICLQCLNRKVSAGFHKVAVDKRRVD